MQRFGAAWLLLLSSSNACEPGDELACSLNGACAVDGKTCTCDDGWVGALCSALHQGPSTRVWPPAGTAGQDPAHLAASWGAGLVPPVAGVSPLWHLYVDSLCIGPAPLACSHTVRLQPAPPPALPSLTT